jgi:hypothetical protein
MHTVPNLPSVEHWWQDVRNDLKSRWDKTMNIQIHSLRKLVPLYAYIACLWSGIAWSQATNSADVSGSVTDPSGAVVPGVTVTITDVDKNLEHSRFHRLEGLRTGSHFSRSSPAREATGPTIVARAWEVYR